MSWYRQQLENWLAELDVLADNIHTYKVLDIGGKQNPVKGRTKTWEVENYKILDLPEFDIQQKAIEYTYYRLSCDLIFLLRSV